MIYSTNDIVNFRSVSQLLVARQILDETLTTSPIRVLHNNTLKQKFKLRFIATCVLSDDFETEISFPLLMSVVVKLDPVVQLVATFVIYPFGMHHWAT
jgi:hypothetical protein